MAMKIYFKSPKVAEGILIQITYRRKRKKTAHKLTYNRRRDQKTTKFLKKRMLTVAFHCCYIH